MEVLVSATPEDAARRAATAVLDALGRGEGR